MRKNPPMRNRGYNDTDDENSEVKMKYKIWLDKWLENCVKPFVKERTYCKYRMIVSRHISPALGEYELEELSAIVLQEFVSGLLGKLSPCTVNGIITPLKASLKQAVQMGVTKAQYADGILHPKQAERRIYCFSIDEQRRIEEYVKRGKTQWLGILVCLYTGLRIGELMALTSDDVDIHTMQISVNKSCYDSWEDGLYFKRLDTPKTPSSKRVIPIPRSLVPYLKRLKKECKSDYLICNKGGDISVRAYQRSFELMLNHLGIAHKGFHSLRHTFATRALECGMDVKTLSEILGHKSVNITLNRYAHSLDEHKVAMMNKLGKLLQ